MSFTELAAGFTLSELGADPSLDDLRRQRQDLGPNPKGAPYEEASYTSEEWAFFDAHLCYPGDTYDPARHLTEIEIFRHLHGVGPHKELLYGSEGEILGVGKNSVGEAVIIQYSGWYTAYNPESGRLLFNIESQIPSENLLVMGPYPPRPYRANFTYPGWLIEMIESYPSFLPHTQVDREWRDFVHLNPCLGLHPSDECARRLREFILSEITPSRQIEVAGGLIEKYWLEYQKVTFEDAVHVLGLDI